MLLGFKSQNHPQQPTKDHVDDRATDPQLFDELNTRFKFSIDVAASPFNAKCERFYDLTSDGLSQSWAGEMVWCNPPFSTIEPWLVKAWREFKTARGIVMLLPANRTEQAWWHRHIETKRDRLESPLRVEFLHGRRRFVRADRTRIGPNERPPFGVCLLIWSHS